MTLTYSTVLAAFQPAKEITDPRRFSGRKAQIERGTQLLIAKDHIFIYGPRGIGKSSIARQLQLIAKGNVELLETLESDLKEEHLDYATCYLARDESINNVNQLLYRLIIDDGALAQFPYLFEQFGQVGTYNLGAELDPKLVSDFWRRAANVAGKHKHGLAIFLDEFELIRSHDGFASFLKAGRDRVVFVITGIALTETELVRDHRSIERQLTTGKLPLDIMSETELRVVVQKAEGSINREIRFSEEAQQALVKVVRGQPYLLHLIGRTALLSAFKQKTGEVSAIAIKTALSTIATEQLDSTLEDRYLQAIGHSPQRESLLRAFAEVCSPGAHTSEVYPVAEMRGVTNPSYYIGDLQKEQFGEEMRKLGEQYYGFKDQLFQAYVVATPARLGKANGSTETTSKTPKQGKSNNWGIEFLHFSDIHFGPTHYFSSLPATGDQIPEADKPTFEKYVIDAIDHDKINPSAIVISGDVTQNGTTSEFTKAAKSLNAILNHFKDKNIEAPVVVICPGNHDVNWAASKADPEARYMPFQAYLTFRNGLTTANKFDSNVDPERMYEIQTLGVAPSVVFTSLNSAVVENEADHRGYVGSSQLENVTRELNAIKVIGEQLRIAVFHHHLIPVPSIEARIEAEKLMADAPHVKQKLREAGIRIALHGHRHHGHAELSTSDQGSQLLVIGCGSSGVIVKERGEQRLQFNRILVSVTDAGIEVRITVYEFDASLRRWTPVPGEPHRSFLLDRV